MDVGVMCFVGCLAGWLMGALTQHLWTELMRWTRDR